jgi:hypothetical protein
MKLEVYPPRWARKRESEEAGRKQARNIQPPELNTKLPVNEFPFIIGSFILQSGKALHTPGFSCSRLISPIQNSRSDIKPLVIGTAGWHAYCIDL